VYKSIFTDIKVAASGAALPIVGLAQSQILMKEIVVGECPEGWLLLIVYLFVNSFFSALQWLELPAMVMDDANSGVES